MVTDLERGDQVVSHIKKNPPDFILLDIMLPGMDGMDVCRELRKLSKMLSKQEIIATVYGVGYKFNVPSDLSQWARILPIAEDCRTYFPSAFIFLMINSKNNPHGL